MTSKCKKCGKCINIEKDQYYMLIEKDQYYMLFAGEFQEEVICLDCIDKLLFNDQ